MLAYLYYLEDKNTDQLWTFINMHVKIIRKAIKWHSIYSENTTGKLQ